MVELLIWSLVGYAVMGGLLVGYSFLAKEPVSVAQRIVLGIGWMPWGIWMVLKRIRDGKLPKL